MPPAGVSYVARSATEECSLPLDTEQCQAHRTAHAAFADLNGFHVGGSRNTYQPPSTLAVQDKYLPFGCQWYVDPSAPEHNRFVYNEARAPGVSISNERHALSTRCAAALLSTPCGNSAMCA